MASLPINQKLSLLRQNPVHSLTNNYDANVAMLIPACQPPALIVKPILSFSQWDGSAD